MALIILILIISLSLTRSVSVTGAHVIVNVTSKKDFKLVFLTSYIYKGLQAGFGRRHVSAADTYRLPVIGTGHYLSGQIDRWVVAVV